MTQNQFRRASEEKIADALNEWNDFELNIKNLIEADLFPLVAELKMAADKCSP